MCFVSVFASAENRILRPAYAFVHASFCVQLSQCVALPLPTDLFLSNISIIVRQPSTAHLTRAGIFETSSRAAASSSCSMSAFYHAHKDVCEAERFGFIFSDDEIEHHIDRRLGDGAAASGKRAVGDRSAIIDLQTERDIVSAARIDAV